MSGHCLCRFSFAMQQDMALTKKPLLFETWKRRGDILMATVSNIIECGSLNLWARLECSSSTCESRLDVSELICVFRPDMVE